MTQHHDKICQHLDNQTWLPRGLSSALPSFPPTLRPGCLLQPSPSLKHRLCCVWVPRQLARICDTQGHALQHCPQKRYTRDLSFILHLILFLAHKIEAPKMSTIEYKMRISKVDSKIDNGKFKFNIKEEPVFCIHQQLDLSDSLFQIMLFCEECKRCPWSEPGA